VHQHQECAYWWQDFDHAHHACRYFTAFDQYLVENYFRGTGALVGDYWHGTNRSSSTSPFFYFNGTEVGSNNSNTNPYVHWSWYHFSFRNGAG
jgi:hypothetical protein